MCKGTADGDKFEIKFVSVFNSNKSYFKNYLSNFKNYHNSWMVRVTSQQFSTLSQKKVFTRADCYLANFDCDIGDLLINNNYFLSEEILEKSKINYFKIPYSGISIKMASSKNFQILKIGPNSFNQLFGNYEIGAGASLYCLRENELHKNLDLIYGWNTTPKDISHYFYSLTNGNESFYLDKEVCQTIKNYCNDYIKNKIMTNEDLQKKIFNGISLYSEPYTAHYFYKGDIIKKLTTIPFNVTTGSGRSKGDYTIVLKP